MWEVNHVKKKNNKLILVTLFLLLCIVSKASQQDINAEKRREKEEWLRKEEKEIKDNKYVLNKIEEISGLKGTLIKRLNVSGNTVMAEIEVEEILEKYIGKKGGNIINCMKELENLYLKKGYLTTRIKIDVEHTKIKEGEITFVVIEGHIEEIVFKDEKFDNLLRERVSLPYKKGDLLKIRDLDQGIDNLNAVSRNNSKFDLVPGKELGGSIVEISNKRSKLISGSLNYNNLGQKSTGDERWKVSLKIEDLLGVSDSLRGSYQKRLGRTKDRRDNANYSLGYRVPYRYWNFSITKDSSNYLSSRYGLNQLYKFNGVSENINYGADRVIYRNENTKTSLGMTLTNKETKNYFEKIKLDSSSRKLSILKTSLSDQRKVLNGVLYSTISYHRGLDMFGAEIDDGKNLNTPKAQFDKYTADFNWYKPFNIKKQKFAYRFAVNSQYSDDILYSSEKMSIGDDTTVRGFKENSLQGDKGIYIRNELSYTYKIFEPFIGYDIGRVKDVYKDRLYNKYGSKLSGISMGLRVSWKYFNSSIIYSKGIESPSYIDKNPQEVYISLSATF